MDAETIRGISSLPVELQCMILKATMPSTLSFVVEHPAWDIRSPSLECLNAREWHAAILLLQTFPSLAHEITLPAAEFEIELFFADTFTRATGRNSKIRWHMRPLCRTIPDSLLGMFAQIKTNIYALDSTGAYHPAQIEMTYYRDLESGLWDSADTKTYKSVRRAGVPRPAGGRTLMRNTELLARGLGAPFHGAITMLDLHHFAEGCRNAFNGGREHFWFWWRRRIEMGVEGVEELGFVDE